MPTTTASDDDNLLDAVERQVMEYNMAVVIQRCWINYDRPSSWQVAFKTDASKHGGEGRTFAMGGGVTLREALQKAFVDVATSRLAPKL